MPKLKRKSESQLQMQNTKAKKAARRYEERRLEEKRRDKIAKKVTREDEEYRLKEKKRDKIFRKITREDEQCRLMDNRKNRNAMKLAREDGERRLNEKMRDQASRKVAREDGKRRFSEKRKDQVARKLARSDEARHRKENMSKKISYVNRQSNFQHLLREYKDNIKEGPTYVCSSCGGLWYRTSVHKASPEKFQEKGCDDTFITAIFNCKGNRQNGHFFCSTCWKSVNKQEPKIPKLCLTNGFAFQPIPSQLLGLTPLEERLVALRLPFVQIRSLGADRQFGMQGNIVNVMNDLDTSAKVLPRQFDESSTVQVMLMRRLCYKRPFMYEVIRPSKVYEAAKYLANTDLYKTEGVILSDDWACVATKMDFVVEDEDRNRVDELQIEPESESNVTAVNEIEKEDEDEQCQQETLVISDAERSGMIHRIAPGEGKRPLSLLRDLDAEVLSFPTIYGGVKREFDPKLKISYTDISKSEARRYDRRCCGSSKILYAYKLSQNKRIAAAIQLCLRKKKTDGCVTAGQIKNDSFVDKLVQHDDGYRMLKGIRGSPAYWESQLKKVMAMLRQLGIPTFFMTLSAAETKWSELLVILVWLLKGERITEEDAMKMTFQEKSELIRNDPITCARNFDHRLRSLLNILLKKPGGVFAMHKLVDYFLRDEFQQRGSPHNHGLYWLENCPVFIENDPESIPRCVEFIDKYITCERKETDGMEEVIQYQIHKHTHTCKKHKSDQILCRFGFPIPPMKSTTILFPLPENFDKSVAQSARKLFAKLKDTLTSLGRNYKEDVSFENFVHGLGLSEEEYIISVRSSIKRPTVFLKRSTNAIFVNPYNETILKAWRANMDIQFILDPYSCAKYCVSYLAKDDSGVSKLLRKINDECRLGNTTVKERLRKFANTFTNFVEISAQEASYGLLGMPLIRSSVFTEYINTSPPEERIFLIKSEEDLAKLPDDSTDISVEGVLKRYPERPDELENTCLADYVALYNYSKTRKGAEEVVDDDLHDDVMNETVDADPRTQTWIRTDTGWLKKRIRPKIIRYRRYGELKDPDNFYREMAMLYVPWRNESEEILNLPARDIYNENKELIDQKRREYDKNGFSEDVNDYIDLEEESKCDENVDPELELTFEDNKTDIYQDMGLVDQNSKFDYIKSPKIIPDGEYWQLIRSLNEKQRKFFLHVLHKVKTGNHPFYELLHGGAGVGKSRVIFSLVQTIVRIYAKEPGRCPDDVIVLVAAFTGKAACNVFGLTLHSAFRLPNSQNTGDIVRLVDDVCNTLRSKLLHLKLIIIDEISMVSVKQLFQIDSRLKQVFQNEQPFGGISILAVGHFRQLKPVMAKYIFEVPKFKILGHVTGNSLWPLFKFYELTEIMRQKGELEFCTALNNMAEGTMTEADIALIKSREISSDLVPPTHAIRLFYSNADCHHYNIIFHSQLGSEQAISTAIDRIQGKATDGQKERLLEQAKNLKVGDADGLPYKVHLQVGAEFFVSTNIDVSDGLFNGCTGTLMKIEYGLTGTQDRIPVRAWMDFKIPFFGANARDRSNQYQLKHGLELSWTSINLDTRVLSRTQRHKHQIVRKQIPLVEANAITIHKSQSSSIEHLVVCVQKRISRELLYVACSRATSLEGLFIDGEFVAPLPPLENDPVTLEMVRLRQNPVQLSLRFLQDIDDSKYKLIVHNVQSLNKHYEDVKSDPCYLAADIMAFVEPWSLQSDVYEFEGFDCTQRIDCPISRNSFGSIVFAKSAVLGQLSEFGHSFHSDCKGHHTFTTWKVNQIQCVLVYKSPNYSLESFYAMLDELLGPLKQEPLLLIGDFNIDLNQRPGNRLLKLIMTYGLESKLLKKCQTTDGGSQIDCCFSNIAGVEASIYESVFSYHKPISVTWPKHGTCATEICTQTRILTTEAKPPLRHLERPSLTAQMESLNILASIDSLLASAIQMQRKIDNQEKDFNIVQNLFIQNASCIREMASILCAQEVRIYENQMVDERSENLLPKPFLIHYVPVLTTAKGNCFYCAISLSLFGTEKYHPFVRLCIINDMLNNVRSYKEFLRLSLAEYCYEDLILNNMRSGSWADPAIMFACSKVINRPINSYDMDFGLLGELINFEQFSYRMDNPIRGDMRHQKYLFHSTDAARPPVCIHFRNMINEGQKNHFVCLLRKANSVPVFPCLFLVYDCRFSQC